MVFSFQVRFSKFILKSNQYRIPNLAKNHKYSKNLSYEYLQELEHTKLVHKVVDLQRKLNAYHEVHHPKNFDGRDKIQVDVPQVSEIVRKKTSVRKIALKFMYTGWDYQSYALTGKKEYNTAGLLNSVERVFLEALMRQQLIPSMKHNNIERTGRTDKMVSGSSQVLSFTARSNLKEGFGVLNANTIDQNDDAESFRINDLSLDAEELNYIKLMNEALPPDIRVIAWSPVRKNFSARFNCQEREYKYFFRQGNFDVELMNESAKSFVGYHDFRNFCKMSAETVEKDKFCRTINSFDIKVIEQDPNNPEFNVCVATIKGKGFLQNQVRKMMSVLCSVGSGHETGDVVERLLDIERTPRPPQYVMCEPHKLVLSGCEYEEGVDVSWRVDEDSLRDCMRIISRRFDNVATKASVLKHMYLKVAAYQTNNALSSNLLFEGGYELSTSVLPEGRHLDSLNIDGSEASTLDEAKDKFAKRNINKELKKGNHHIFRESLKKE